MIDRDHRLSVSRQCQVLGLPRSTAYYQPVPPLFVVGSQGDGQLVNYRFRSPYYVVDRLFGAAELRLGSDKADVVRIERTDGIDRSARRQ